jgi:hypothetical protein
MLLRSTFLQPAYYEELATRDEAATCEVGFRRAVHSFRLLRRMSFEFGNCLLHFFLPGGIFRQRLVCKRREEVIPDGVHLALEVAGVGGVNNHRVLVGNDDAELATRAVAAKGIVGAAPELEAVTLLPVDADFGMRFLIVGNLLAGCLFNPFLRNQLLAVPLSFLQVELAKFGDVFGADSALVAHSGLSIPSGSNNRGVSNSFEVWPVTLVTMAERT